jgi:hypothetical protein
MVGISAFMVLERVKDSWGQQVLIILVLQCLWTNAGFGQRWEITPLIGHGAGGEFEEEVSGQTLKLSDDTLSALAINYTSAQDPSSQLEVYLSHQETRLAGNHLSPAGSSFDLDVDYYHIGGTLLFGKERFEPFIVGTIGATHFNPGPSHYDSLTRASLGLGGGVKLFASRNIGLRLEGRLLTTLVSGESVFISDSSGLRIYVKGDMFFQFLLNAGVVFRF